MLLLLSFSAGLACLKPCSAAPFQWEYTGSLNTARQNHSATLLRNGRVLVAGGYDNGVPLASAELYDPATGTWSPTGDLNTARGNHTATLLRNGKVLVTGGYDTDYLSSAELYDPATGTWLPTGSLDTGRDYPTATLLANGKVLVAGDLTSAISQAPNSTIRSLALGEKPAASISREASIRLLSCPTAWSSSREVKMTSALWESRNSTIRLPAPGR